MKTLQRRAAAVSAPLLLALSLTACGGSDASSAPDDASSEDFCDTFLNLDSDVDPDDADAQLKAAQDLADQLSDVGTPAEFSDDARDGFEVFIDYIGDLDSGDVEEFMNASDPGDVLDDDDAAKVTAFTTEATQACIGDLDLGDTGDELEDQLGDLESEFPTDTPS